MNNNPIINTKPKMRKTDLYLTIRQHEKISEIAREKGITFSELFRQIIERYLEDHEK